VDELKILLLKTQGGYGTIFGEADLSRTGVITADDICGLCKDNGVQLERSASWVIGRYFRIWGEGMSLMEFSKIMKPKLLVH
jgi:hypothetical protein